MQQLEQPSTTTQHSPLLREVWAAWQITPHDAAWKRNLHAALTEIGGSMYDLQNAFEIVRENLIIEQKQNNENGIS